MTATTDRVSALVEPIAEQLGLTVYDVDQPGGTLRVMLDAPGGVDLDALAEATRQISAALDSAQPLAGSYTLEVSSPGLERPLRKPIHWQGAVGERVKVKLMPGVEGDRRAEGVLVRFDGDTATIGTDEGERTVALADVSGARTVFEWESGKSGKSGKASGKSGKAPGAKGSKGPKSTSSKSGAERKHSSKSEVSRAAAAATATPTTESSEEST